MPYTKFCSTKLLIPPGPLFHLSHQDTALQLAVSSIVIFGFSKLYGMQLFIKKWTQNVPPYIVSLSYTLSTHQ